MEPAKSRYRQVTNLLPHVSVRKQSPTLVTFQLREYIASLLGLRLPHDDFDVAGSFRLEGRQIRASQSNYRFLIFDEEWYEGVVSRCHTFDDAA